MMNTINQAIHRLRDKLYGLAHDKKGVAAVEFALIAPLLITLYLGTLEISGALQINKKVGRSASSAAELISRLEIDGTTKKISSADIDAILKIGKATIQPYNFTAPTVTATGIKIDGNGIAKISWSRRLTDDTYSQPFTPDTTITVPPRLVINNSFLVKVETSLEYRTLTSLSISRDPGKSYGSLDMAETYYHRPRTTEIDFFCDGC